MYAHQLLKICPGYQRRSLGLLRMLRLMWPRKRRNVVVVILITSSKPQRKAVGNWYDVSHCCIVLVSFLVYVLFHITGTESAVKLWMKVKTWNVRLALGLFKLGFVGNCDGLSTSPCEVWRMGFAPVGASAAPQWWDDHVVGRGSGLLTSPGKIKRALTLWTLRIFCHVEGSSSAE